MRAHPGTLCARFRSPLGEASRAPRRTVRRSMRAIPKPPPTPSPCAVRVKFADVSRIPEILKSIPAEEVQRLQTNIAQHWRR